MPGRTLLSLWAPLGVRTFGPYIPNTSVLVTVVANTEHQAGATPLAPSYQDACTPRSALRLLSSTRSAGSLYDRRFLALIELV